MSLRSECPYRLECPVMAGKCPGKDKCDSYKFMQSHPNAGNALWGDDGKETK